MFYAMSGFVLVKFLSSKMNETLAKPSFWTPPGLTAVVKHEDYVMSWYGHGKIMATSPWYVA